MFKKPKEKELIQKLQDLYVRDPHFFYDHYKVAIAVDGKVEQILDVNLSLYSMLLSNPVILSANNNEYKVGELI